MIPSWEGNKGIENDAANKIRDSPRQYYYYYYYYYGNGNGNGNGIELAQKRESMAWLFTQSKEKVIIWKLFQHRRVLR